MGGWQTLYKIPGKVTLRMDLHKISNNDVTRDSDSGKIIAPQVSFLSFDKQLYLDMGYADSGYARGLKVKQLTPTVGFAFNQQSDWLQLRGYFIRSSERTRTQGEKNTKALEAKLIHYCIDCLVNLDEVTASVLFGQRVFAVDGDSGSVYNLADIQRGAISLGGTWKLSGGWSAQLFGGVGRYENKTIDDKYDNRYVYLGVSKEW